MNLHRFDSPAAMAQAVAGRAAAILAEAVTERGRAVLALSGGSTPKLYLPALDSAFAHWDKVEAFLTDERWVPLDHPDSNEALVRGLLPRTHLTGLVNAAADPEAGLAETRRRLEALPQPWDLALLGMGEDGHIASLFPGTGAVHDPDPFCTAVRDAPLHPRLSLSAKALMRFGHRLMIISGERKLDVLSQATQDGLPVSLLLQEDNRLDVFASP